MQVTSRVFVVTGGGGGIGREVVLELLRRGARVAAVDLRGGGLAETARISGATGGRLTCHEVDVADAERVTALREEVVAAHGAVDGLLNVAGIIQRFVPFADLAPADAETVMAVNFWGVVNTVRAFLPDLLARPEAALVNVSSMGAFVPVPGQTVYGASKAAVQLLTEGLWAELRETSVAVTVVHPGAVATHIAENSGVEVPGGSDPAADRQAARTTTAEDAARQVVRGMERGRFRVLVGRDASVLDLLSRLSRRRATAMVAARMANLLDTRARSTDAG